MTLTRTYWSGVGVVAWAVMLVAAGPVAADDAAQVVMTPHTFNDPQSGNMPSHTVLAPKGWTVEGGAYWAGAQLFGILPSQNIKVTAPDGRRVHVGPSLTCVDIRPSAQAMQMGATRPPEGQIDNGLPLIYMPDNLAQWQAWMAQKTLPQERPGARDIQVRVTVVPELTQLMHRQLAPLAEQQQQLNVQARQLNLAMQHFIDGAVLAFECRYTQDGRQWDELIVFGIAHMGTHSQTGTQLRWGIEPNVAYRAPAGQLEQAMPLLMAIANSVQPTPQWAKMKADHVAAMNRIALKGAADRSRIIAQANAEINQIIREGFEQRQAAQDRTHEKFINAIREVENYTVPGSSTQVQLPNSYKHVFANGNGEYILTNDALYNPNADQNVNNLRWEPMQVVNP
jgi:hypothetical protein